MPIMQMEHVQHFQSVLFSYPKVLNRSFGSPVTFLLHESRWQSINAKVTSHDVFCLLASVEGTTVCLEIPLRPPPLPPGDREGVELTQKALNWLVLQCSKAKQCTEIHSYDHMPVSRGYMRVQYPLLMAPGDRQFPTVAPPPPLGDHHALPRDIAGGGGYLFTKLASGLRLELVFDLPCPTLTPHKCPAFLSNLCPIPPYCTWASSSRYAVTLITILMLSNKH